MKHHAADLLDLTPDEEDRFFYLDGWPRKLLKEYDADVKPKDRARVTCKRIDLFLKSGADSKCTCGSGREFKNCCGR